MAAAATPERGRPVSRKARPEEAPKALWAPVPVTEVLILVGLVLTVVGFLGDVTLLIVGILMASVAALELAIREHFAGYKSHSTLLAGVAALLVVVPMTFLSVPSVVLLIAAGLVGVAAWQLLRSAFAARAGGLKFRA